jgi:ubiquinone/menaquinone biosynthesis C-methylase UbiE
VGRRYVLAVTKSDHVVGTRAAYDTVASEYADLLRDELSGKPVDRAVLGLFAELVGPSGRVADLGCGPGRITGHLASLDLDAFGMDLSPGMVSVARRDHPHLSFIEGNLTSLNLSDRSVAGVVAWYSIIHTPPTQLPEVFAEFARVLAPGGWLLLAFQAGNEQLHLTHAYGHDISLDAWRLDPADVSALLTNAGLTVTTHVVRAADDREKTPQCYLLATNGKDL